MKGFVPIFCGSSQGWGFTSQPWHKNKMFIYYDAWQNVFLLMCKALADEVDQFLVFHSSHLGVCVHVHISCLMHRLQAMSKPVGVGDCLIARPKGGALVCAEHS